MKKLSITERAKLFEKKKIFGESKKSPLNANTKTDETNQTSLRKKKYTNFEEILSEYKNCNFKITEEEELINEFKKVFDFYKEKKAKIEKELEGERKLFLFRFKKAKELIQIYKIFELQTDVLFNLIDYHKNPNPSTSQQQFYLKMKERGQKIIKFKKNEENFIIKKILN